MDYFFHFLCHSLRKNDGRDDYKVVYAYNLQYYVYMYIYNLQLIIYD